MFREGREGVGYLKSLTISLLFGGVSVTCRDRGAAPAPPSTDRSQEHPLTSSVDFVLTCSWCSFLT